MHWILPRHFVARQNQLSLFVRPLVLKGTIMVEGAAVGWGTLALINAGLAQAKGRSGLFWFFASLLIGPLATFLIVILNAVVEDE